MIPYEAEQSVHGQEMRRCTEGSVENLATEGRKMLSEPEDAKDAPDIA